MANNMISTNSVLLREQIGDAIRCERHRQRRTLEDIANTACMTFSYLSEVERGHKEISSELLNRVCDALHVSLANMLASVGLRIAYEQGKRA